MTSIQAGRCFYCNNPLRMPVEVDYFVPWAWYPVDLAHNFVLTHATCNNAKKSRRAAYQHLERWCERNAILEKELADAFDRAGLLHDLVSSVWITQWAYEQTEAAGGQVWPAVKRLVTLHAAWRLLPDFAA